MEVRSIVNSVLAKRLWNVVRITFFMIRNGLVPKRKLIVDMNLLMKRGKLLRKSLSNPHHHSSKHMTRGGFGIQEYEFSCSSTPNPVFSRVPKSKHRYFPCINPPEVIQEEEEYFEQEPKAPEYTFNFPFDASDLAPAEKRSPLPSPSSVRISNYSLEDENDTGNQNVDDKAEEFIRRFYEQLRVQSRSSC